MVTSTKTRNRSDIVHWETNPNYTRLAATLEGLDGVDFVNGVPLEDGTGENYKVATSGAGITAILLSSVGTVATGDTESVVALVRGSAIVLEENLVAVAGVTNAEIIVAIAANQLPGVISQSVGNQEVIPDVLG